MSNKTWNTKTIPNQGRKIEPMVWTTIVKALNSYSTPNNDHFQIPQFTMCSIVLHSPGSPWSRGKSSNGRITTQTTNLPCANKWPLVLIYICLVDFVGQQHKFLVVAKLNESLQVFYGQALARWVTRIDEDQASHLHNSDSACVKQFACLNICTGCSSPPLPSTTLNNDPCEETLRPMAVFGIAIPLGNGPS